MEQVTVDVSLLSFIDEVVDILVAAKRQKPMAKKTWKTIQMSLVSTDKVDGRCSCRSGPVGHSVRGRAVGGLVEWYVWQLRHLQYPEMREGVVVTRSVLGWGVMSREMCKELRGYRWMALPWRAHPDRSCIKMCRTRTKRRWSEYRHNRNPLATPPVLCRHVPPTWRRKRDELLWNSECPSAKPNPCTGPCQLPTNALGLDKAQTAGVFFFVL